MTETPESKNRVYHIGIRECIVRGCNGEVSEISYYERNNWATAEFECHQCKKRFVVKVEC